MPEMSGYREGVPSWTDLASPDVEASKAFYSALFGWEANTVPAPEAGGYTLFTMNGKQVAGVGPIMTEGQPSVWMTYVNVADADGIAKQVADAGGDVLMAPMDVLDQGRLAVFADPTGAVIGVWQPAAHTGAQLVNEPVSYCWSELATRDVDGAKAFYSAVFGWDSATGTDGPMAYTEFKVDGDSIAGMFQMAGMMPDDVPPHWGVYFAVADCDATVDAASGLGASVAVPAMDVPIGRFAALTDPHGAFFRVIKLASES